MAHVFKASGSGTSVVSLKSIPTILQSLSPRGPGPYDKISLWLVSVFCGEFGLLDFVSGAEISLDWTWMRLSVLPTNTLRVALEVPLDARVGCHARPESVSGLVD